MTIDTNEIKWNHTISYISIFLLIKNNLSGVQLILCGVFALWVVVLCTLCCQFLCVVLFWLPLRYSLTFINPATFYWSAWTKPGKWAIMYLCLFSTYFLLNFGTVPTVWCFVFFLSFSVHAGSWFGHVFVWCRLCLFSTIFLFNFGNVPTVWYFGTVPTVWYFRTVPTVWYFFNFIIIGLYRDLIVRVVKIINLWHELESRHVILPKIDGPILCF